MTTIGAGRRCFGDGDPLYERYHDEEWGRPRTDEQSLFEKICLEGFQAGLAWITVLRKRDALRGAFRGFDPDAVARMDPDADVAALLQDATLIRSAPKLRACITNARATLALRDDGGLPALLWSAAEVPGPALEDWADVPASTPASARLARDLKRRGFVFVGATTVYSLMQACGLVDDHLAACPVRGDVEAQRSCLPDFSPSGSRGIRMKAPSIATE
jgi:DNA-3-methyladenine glycosylase I